MLDNKNGRIYSTAKIKGSLKIINSLINYSSLFINQKKSTWTLSQLAQSLTKKFVEIFILSQNFITQLDDLYFCFLRYHSDGITHGFFPSQSLAYRNWPYRISFDPVDNHKLLSHKTTYFSTFIYPCPLISLLKRLQMFFSILHVQSRVPITTVCYEQSLSIKRYLWNRVAKRFVCKCDCIWIQ